MHGCRLADYDVVITTYGVLTSELSEKRTDISKTNGSTTDDDDNITQFRDCPDRIHEAQKKLKKKVTCSDLSILFTFL